MSFFPAISEDDLAICVLSYLNIVNQAFSEFSDKVSAYQIIVFGLLLSLSDSLRYFIRNFLLQISLA